MYKVQTYDACSSVLVLIFGDVKCATHVIRYLTFDMW